MTIRSDEITSIIRSEINALDEGVDVSGVGTIVEVGDGIAQVFLVLHHLYHEGLAGRHILTNFLEPLILANIQKQGRGDAMRRSPNRRSTEDAGRFPILISED